MSQNEALMTVGELAAWLKVKESTIRKWVCFQRIPFLKLGRSVRFRREDVSKWLESQNPQNARWEVAPPVPSLGRYNPGVR